MTLESTIRNLITESASRKGAGRILSESWFDVSVETAQRQQIGRNIESQEIKHAERMAKIKASQSNAPQNAEEARLQALSGYASRDQWEKYRHLLPKNQQQQQQSTASPEHPSQLSPMDLAKKEGTSPDKLAQRAKEIEDSREKLRQDRMKFDAERPQGQPASFTPTGEAPKPGETSSGVKVPQPGTPEFAARRELERISAQRPPVDRSATQQPTPPETQAEKPQADMAATSSSVPNPRMAGGGVQTGSGLNVSNIQAGQHSFTRQPLRASYDPMESRKNFIRESVILSLNQPKRRSRR